MKRVAFAAILAALPAAAQAAGDAERGAYLAAIMDCQGCHSGRTPDGALDPARHLTGGDAGFELPGLGIFWPPNLTSDATGLGGWTDDEIVAAIRTGQRPDGRILAPIMPWQSYAVLSEEDARDLVAYLRSLPPTASAVPAPAGSRADAGAPYFSMVLPE
jgi:mono/diheme cytochrome c family protein